MIKIGKLIVKFLILLFSLMFLTPLYIAIVNSVKPYEDVIKSPLSLPENFTWDNFIDAYQSSQILELYKNSILITVVSVALIILLSSLSAYIIARRNEKIYKVLFVFALAGIMVPPVVTLVPSIMTLNWLNLLHTMPGLYLFYAGTYFSTAIFLYVQFIKTIPISMDEAATIDGAGPFTLFWRIIFPMVKPCTATAIIFLSMWIWNDFLNPMYILGLSGGRTITTGIFSAIGSYTSRWNLVFANVVLASLPIIILYLTMQKQFMSGMTSGAVKG
jgi:raffinose/stachyose/melibiose transport system permease protein